MAAAFLTMLRHQNRWRPFTQMVLHQLPQQHRPYSITMPSPSKLADILVMESLQDKTGEEIGNIWLQVRGN